MSDIAADPSFHGARARDFFLARQPILNRGQGLVAYELLFRRADAGTASVIDDLAATAAVIEHATELGMENVIGGSLGFVNIDKTVLMSDFVQFLPRDKVVLEILETVKVTSEVIERVTELRKAGYTFALDDVINESEDVRMLLPHVDIIKVDIAGLPPSTLTELSTRFRSARKKLLAEKVENIDEYKRCLELGFDYFQGYYFAKPAVLSGKKLSPSQVALLRLMSQLSSDADNAVVERTIKQDASLGITLLRMANSPALGTGHRIKSLAQALMLLGRRQLQRWVQILLYAEPMKATGLLSPLLVLATTRGKLLELMADRIAPRNRNMADVAFTVGIMSLMDALFDQPMAKILEQMLVDDAVRDALLEREGVYGEMLQLAEYMEQLDEYSRQLFPALDGLSLSHEDLCDIQLEAYAWSEQVSHQA
ncbi:EAL and HDOD domain-containing protein [Noviherbaspirillum denitrificans]|uniref:Diguanylate phosphodiesterase n=1 Tax=Noviherbaspirillum denitrificans TaxID=1968433 RepID=A0A254THN2_9BURK|nr:EAL domain-containing protein [Noviherbaspirillum denitrificans]OWW22156.1 diguanylate phosphodiesterase [Noviherbaspirillum denitrificans]